MATKAISLFCALATAVAAYADGIDLMEVFGSSGRTKSMSESPYGRRKAHVPSVLEKGYVPAKPVQQPVAEKTVTNTVEKVVERIVEKPVEVVVEKQVTNTVEKVVEKVVERPVEVVVEKQVTNTVEKVVEKVVEKPVEVVVERPVTNTVEKVVEKVVEKPVEVVVEKLVTNVVEKVVEKPVEVVVERHVTNTVEVVVEKVVTNTVEKVVRDRDEELRLQKEKERASSRADLLEAKNTDLSERNEELARKLNAERERRERLERALPREKRALTGRPARITSAKTYYDRKEGIAFFDRQVHVDDEQYQMWADRAYVFTAGTNDLRRIVAIGHVALTNEARRAYGVKASYYKEGGMVVLYGNDERPAEVRDESKVQDQVVKGRKIKFWIDSEQVEVLEANISAPTSGVGKDGFKKALGGAK